MSKKKNKKTLEEFKEEKEYKIWAKIYEICNEKLHLSEGSFTNETCDGVYWEPLLVLIYKFGVYAKLTKKLKEVKMDFIRPITYLGDQSNKKVKIDDDPYIVDQGGISGAAMVRVQFSNFLRDVYEIENLDDSNHAKAYKELRTQLKRFFDALDHFVKSGWRQIHENVKEVLLPFRMLRKSGYRLFSLELMQAKNQDITMFLDKKEMAELVKALFQIMITELEN